MVQARKFPPDRVTVVGVLNLTPDSFSDGGRFAAAGAELDLEVVVEAAAAMEREGAHVIDVGGESTRPGAAAVPVEVEIARTRPVVAALAGQLGIPIAIDTRKSEVAEAALAAGATLVNDVSGLRFDPTLADVAARAGAGLILGHLRGTPETMQDAPHFHDVVAEVTEELRESVDLARSAGVPAAQLVVDPGIGFGKRLEPNLALLAHVGVLRERLGLPVLVGPSRKSFLGEITGDPVAARETATSAACAVAVFAGADAVRVHDVPGAVRAVAVAQALREARRKERA